MGEVIAVIPARGGSLRLPGKNIMPIGGKPLLAYPIEAAWRAPEVSRVIVSTDDRRIADIAEEHRAEVIERPSELARADSAIDDAYRHVLDCLAAEGAPVPEIIVGMQANIPIHRDGEISLVIHQTREAPWATAVATAKRVSERPEWMKKRKHSGTLEILPISEPDTRYRMQDLPEIFLLDGAVIALRPDVLRRTTGDRRAHAYLGERVLIHVHEAAYSVEIDDETDVALAEFYMQRLVASTAARTA